MIKFFRKIRYNLMSENKTGKYLKYAIGEIVLVVIGILIALSINNWNENRKSSNAEAKALVELLAEFKKNQIDLMRVYRIKTNAGKRLNRYLHRINNDSVPDSEKSYVYKGVGTNTWNTQYTVLNSLLSSGAINNIKNDSLKHLLTTWNDYTDDYLEQQDDYFTTVRDFSNYLRDKVPDRFIVLDSAYRNWDYKRFESKEETQRLSKKIIYSIEYQNFLKEIGHKLYIQARLIQPLKNNYSKIIVLLEEEINIKK